MPTLADYATRVHTNIAAIDNGHWSVDLVKSWVKQALEQWPILKPVTVEIAAATDGQTLFELDTKVQYIISVYHVEQDHEIRRGQYTPSEANGLFYWFVNRSDDTLPNELRLSAGAGLSISGGDTLVIEVMMQHEYALADDDALTVPSHQLNLLQKMVTILALENRLTYHSQQFSEQDVEWLTQVVNRLKREFDKAVKDTPDPVTLSPYIEWELGD